MSMESRTAYSTWTPQKPTLFDGHFLRNRSTLDIGVLGYIGIVQHKEHSPEVLSIPRGTPCISSHLIRSQCYGGICSHIIDYGQTGKMKHLVALCNFPKMPIKQLDSCSCHEGKEEGADIQLHRS